MADLINSLPGDISENQGPSDTESSNSDITKDSLDLSIFGKKSVHYIQSQANKVNQLQVELSHFDVIALSETWFNPNMSDDGIRFQNFQKPFRKDRIHINYGCNIIYAKENIVCKRPQDLENNQIESIWVKLTLEAKSILLFFYMPPNSPASAIGDIETSIDVAFDNNIKNILAAGDFNLNYLNKSCQRKINSLFRPYNLSQLIEEPTHFTESSSSVIDLVATQNANSVIYSGG